MVHGAILILPIMVLIVPLSSYAQTVSIVTVGDDSSNLVLEAAMKRNLRAEGYTVKGGTNEGFILLMQSLPLSRQSAHMGAVAGQIIIGNLQWQTMADSMVSSQCKEEHQLVQNVKGLLGTQMLLIESTMAIAENEERLAELLSTFANTHIRKAASKIRELVEAVDQRGQEERQRNVYSPMR
jgi:hypothetical protein